MDSNEISDFIIDIQYIGNKNKLCIDAINMYNTFYEQHKLENDNYAYTREGYYEKIKKRYDWIICQMNYVLEEKINKNKQTVL